MSMTPYLDSLPDCELEDALQTALQHLSTQKSILYVVPNTFFGNAVRNFFFCNLPFSGVRVTTVETDTTITMELTNE